MPRNARSQLDEPDSLRQHPRRLPPQPLSMTAVSHRPIAAATISSRVTRTPTAVETATIPPSLISAFNSSTGISNNSATVFSGK